VGGDRLDYNGETATSTADIKTFKILINSTLSTKDAKMMMMMLMIFIEQYIIPKKDRGAFNHV
jgi:hypothetical protein